MTLNCSKNSHAFSASYIINIVFILSIVLVAGCNKDKKNITGPETPPVDEPDPIVASFETEPVFGPGEFALINVEGSELTSDEYEAQLSDSTKLDLYRYPEDQSNQTLFFVVPHAEAGEQQIIFSIEGQKQELDLTIESYEQIDNPDKYIANFTDSLLNVVNGTISNTKNEEFKNNLISERDSLIEAVRKIDQFEDDEVMLIARVIKTNLQTGMQKMKVNSLVCEDVDFNGIKNLLKASGGALLTGYSVALATMAPGLGTIVGLTTGVIGALYALDHIEKIAEQLPKIGECASLWFDEALYTFRSSSSDKLKNIYSVSVFEFEHGVSKSLELSIQYEAPNDFLETLEEFRSTISSFEDKVPADWISIFNDDYSVFTENSDMEGMSIESNSDPRIDHASETLDSTIVITLEYKPDEMLDIENQEFELTIDGSQSDTYKLKAVLKPPKPTVVESTYSVEPNKSITDTLMGNFVAIYKIGSTPSQGELALDDENLGVFTYTPDNGFTGTDIFTVIGANSFGDSEEVDVKILVNNGYVLQIGNYYPDYDLIEPVLTVENGEELTLPNYMEHMVRLIYQGEPVAVGEFGLPWTGIVLGDKPKSGDDLIIDDYQVKVYDATNRRTATISLDKITLTNGAYDIIVGNSFQIENKIVKFNDDWTYNWRYEDNSSSGGGSFNFTPTITPANVSCSDNTIDKYKIGSISMSKLNLGFALLGWIMIYEDGSVSANSFYGCENNHRYVDIKKL